MKQRLRLRKSARRANRQRQRILVLGGAVLAVALIVFFACYFTARSAVNKVPENIICDNIFIDDIDVSGMNAKEAKAALKEKLTEYQALKITLKAEEAKVDVTLGDLGFEMKSTDKLIEKAVAYGKEGSIWNRHSDIKALEENKKVIKATYTVDAKAVEKVIAEKMPELENAAKNATITRSNGTFVFTDEVKGVAIDSAESVKAIETYFNKNW